MYSSPTQQAIISCASALRANGFRSILAVTEDDRAIHIYAENNARRVLLRLINDPAPTDLAAIKCLGGERDFDDVILVCCARTHSMATDLEIRHISELEELASYLARDGEPS